MRKKIVLGSASTAASALLRYGCCGVAVTAPVLLVSGKQPLAFHPVLNNDGRGGPFNQLRTRNAIGMPDPSTPIHRVISTTSSSHQETKISPNHDPASGDGQGWQDIVPFEKGSHNSAKIAVPAVAPEDQDPFHRSTFRIRLENTVKLLTEMEKSSVWVQVPMARASLIEDMVELGFRFHNAEGDKANLNLWLKDSASMVPEFATTNIGVGAMVINSRDEILCVRELRTNYRPWKVPTGRGELGEDIPDAAEREVMEETGIATKFRSILCFRHTHGLANGRSDLFFVCRLDPIEGKDGEGNAVIPDPTPQESEIEKAEWIPVQQYRDMVYGLDGGPGHPMMQHVMDLYDGDHRLVETEVTSVVPGRRPSPIYHPFVDEMN